MPSEPASPVLEEPTAPLALGLQRVLIGAFLAAMGLAALAWVALTVLDRNVDRWWTIEKVDAARESLLEANRAMDPGLNPSDATAILEAFDVIAAQAERILDLNDSSGFATEIVQSLSLARTFLLGAETYRADAVTWLDDIEDRRSALADLAAQWNTSLGRQIAASKGRADALDEVQRTGYVDLQAITDAILGVDATARHLRADPAGASPTSAAQATPTRPQAASDVPQPNPQAASDVPQPNPQAGTPPSPQPSLPPSPQASTQPSKPPSPPPTAPPATGRPAIPTVCATAAGAAPLACAETEARLRAALDRIDAAPAQGRGAAIAAALAAAAAHSAALERHYRARAADLDAALSASRSERHALLALRRAQTSVVRVARYIADLGARLDAVRDGTAPALATLRRELETRFQQIGPRLRGVQTMVAAHGATQADIPAALAAIDAAWRQARVALAGRERSLANYQSQLDRIAARISERSRVIRDETTAWIDLFARVTFAVLGGVALLVLAATWASYRRVTLPLSELTVAILRIARGDSIPALAPQRRVLGLDQLAAAVERLRRVDVERRDLLRRNASQRSQIEAQLRTLEQNAHEMTRRALHDALTGLPNRRHADEHLPDLQAAARREGRAFALMHIDVDRFKEINDTIGHDAGDHILIHVATVLRRLCEESDRAFRIGGDEFLISRLGDIREADLAALATEIIDTLNIPVDFEGHACRIGASIGIAYGDDADGDARATLVNADLALYRAKNEGRNRYTFFSEELQRESQERKDLGDQLYQAIEAAEFVPWYQPQVFGRSQELRGIEVLCRWNHPERGILAPGAFFDTAQDMHLLGQIDRILFSKVSEDLQKLNARDFHVPKISLNIGTDRLLHHDLATSLRDNIGDHIDIAVELLESTSLDNLSEAMRWSIDMLKERGIGIEIDDFGRSKASISGLIAVSPNAMKIDATIIRPIVTSPQHLRLVEAIIEIGTVLDIEVVAEGAETEEHLEILERIGCSVIQGYAVARPMPIDTLIAYLDATRAPHRSAS